VVNDNTPVMTRLGMQVGVLPGETDEELEARLNAMREAAGVEVLIPVTAEVVERLRPRARS
jgi:hypothetical protein